MKDKELEIKQLKGKKIHIVYDIFLYFIAKYTNKNTNSTKP